jgi:ABC-type transport system substrate-binding protein
MLDRRGFLATSAAFAAAVGNAEAAMQQVLRIGMTASDLPTVTGIPNNGGEGYRFLGYPVYDAVVNWDYTHPNELADATPGLFESWTIDPAAPTRWVFKLRQGVVFHDGSALTMDDVVWNLRRTARNTTRNPRRSFGRWSPFSTGGRRSTTRRSRCTPRYRSVSFPTC